MASATANGIQIEYETFGDKESSPILLIIGINSQMIMWDDPLCEKLAGSDHYVIRFDNRDVGLSSKFEDAGTPDIMEAFGNLIQGKPINAPYTFSDMACDTVSLMDALGISKAHICGMSMGACIAQTIAIEYPERLLSLIPIYGSTGNPELPQAKPEAIQSLLAPFPEEKETFVERALDTYRIFAGSRFPFDEEWHKDLAGRSFDRGLSAGCLNRQILAGMGFNRKPALANVKVPTLVIHGTEDPIMPVEGGKDTAEAIPNSELMLVEGMGHDLPKLGGAWDEITDRIIEFCTTIDG